MEVQLRIHELDEVVQSKELGSHARLVSEEVSLLEEVSIQGIEKTLWTW
jgi:hypothetical protein